MLRKYKYEYIECWENISMNILNVEKILVWIYWMLRKYKYEYIECWENISMNILNVEKIY